MAYTTVNFHQVSRVRLVKQSHTNKEGVTTYWLELQCDDTQLINVFAVSGNGTHPSIEIIDEKEVVPLPAS